MTFTRKLFLAGLLTVLVAVVGLFVVFRSGHKNGRESNDRSERRAPVAVRTAKVALRDAQEFNEFPGTVQSRVSVSVMAQITGRISALNARSGLKVKKGDLLVRLDATEIKSRLQQAESGLAAATSALAASRSDLLAAKSRQVAAEAGYMEARKDYERYKRLVEQNVEPRQKLEQAEARWKTSAAAVETAKANVKAADAALEAQASVVTQARGRIEETRAQFQYTSIRSPMDGVVVDKQVEPGDLAAPGRALLSLQSPLELRMEAPVSERCARRIRTGNPVGVKLDALDVSLNAHVSEIVPAIDPGSRSFLVRADLPVREDLQPGMFGRLRFPCEARKVLSIPAGAVIARGQLDIAYVVQAAKAHMRLVRLGRRSGDSLEVLSGLAAGDAVILAPSPALQDGDPVREAAQPGETRP